MKNVLIKIVIPCCFTIICLDTYAVADNIRNIAAIEVRGLSLLTKKEIVSAACTGSGNGNITVNLTLLDQHLRSMPLVERYAIDEDKGRLTIDVTEKRIFALLAVIRDGRLVPFEIDESFTPMRGGRIYSPDNPLVVLDGLDRLTSDVKEFLVQLDHMRNGDAALFRELAEIHFRPDGSLDVYMRSRRTGFMTGSRKDFFRNMKAAVSYLDARRRYPESVWLGSDGFVLR